MVDASRYNLEGNIRMTREIVEFAKQFDASVEGEIGCMGASEGDNYTDDDMKTNPDEALRFAKETGIDALAISFGSSHGNYPEGYVPEFDFERLKEIKEKQRCHWYCMGEAVLVMKILKDVLNLESIRSM